MRTCVSENLGRWALLAALIFHAVLLLTIWPHIDFWPETERPRQVRKMYVVQQVRFRAPLPPPAGGRQQERKDKRLIPVPDLTPDLPERWVAELPEIVLPEVELDLEIPPGPPGPVGPSSSVSSTGNDAWAAAAQRHGAGKVTGGMSPPVKIYWPQPEYTEAAQEKKLEGFVIVETIIDAAGNVVEAKIRKGMPLGLSESAIEAVMSWKFKPATRDGQPVPVFFIVSVAFRLH